MQIWFLSNINTVIVDFAAWFVIHMAGAYGFTMLPAPLFRADAWFFRSWGWEKGGAVYQRWFRIKSWKKKLPDGAALFRKGFRKKRLKKKDPAYLRRFVRETCRGEAAHWAVMCCAPLFFLWNPPWAGWVMIVYACIANLPCIMTQRFNRPFFKKLLKEQEVS